MTNTRSSGAARTLDPWKVFGVYARQLDRVYVVPVADCARLRGYLRCTPTRNNQQRGVRYAADYAIEDWARSLARPGV
jgi:PD-(D/E)XK endonuclease